MPIKRMQMAVTQVTDIKRFLVLRFILIIDVLADGFCSSQVLITYPG